jgi:hypothetical protein
MRSSTHRHFHANIRRVECSDIMKMIAVIRGTLRFSPQCRQLAIVCRQSVARRFQLFKIACATPDKGHPRVEINRADGFAQG